MMEEKSVYAQIQEWIKAQQSMNAAAVGDLVALAKQRVAQDIVSVQPMNVGPLVRAVQRQTVEAQAAYGLKQMQSRPAPQPYGWTQHGVDQNGYFVRGQTVTGVATTKIEAGEPVKWSAMGQIEEALSRAKAPFPKTMKEAAAKIASYGMRIDCDEPTPESLSFDNLLSPTWKAPEPEAPPADVLKLAEDGSAVLMEANGNRFSAEPSGLYLHLRLKTADDAQWRSKIMDLSEAEALLVVLKTFVRGAR